LKKNSDRRVPRVYRDNRQTLIFAVLSGVLVAVYILFFMSSYLLPASFKNPDRTELNKEIRFGDNRSVIVYSCDFSENEKVLELKLRFTNESYDGVNNYQFDAKLSKGPDKKVTAEEIMSDTLLTVVRIEPVKKGFDVMTLYFGPKKDGIDEDDIGKIVIEEKQATLREELPLKDKDDYLSERLDVLIKKYSDDSKTMLKEKNEKNRKISNLSMSITGLEESKKYQTSEETAEAEESIRKMYLEIDSLKEEIEELTEAISFNERQIDYAEDRKKEIGK